MRQQHKAFMGQFAAARNEVATLRNSPMGESAKFATLSMPAVRSTSAQSRPLPPSQKKRP